MSEDSAIPIRNGSTEPSASLMDSKMLEKIDALFNCGVGEYIDLPQIVVVGDQSSGKSSVLEGLTGIPFPRDKTLCTTFATKVIFRRSEWTSTTMSIIPSEDSTDDHRRVVNEWGKHIDKLEEFDPDTFKNMFTEVRTIMGIEDGTTASFFSDDILCIEICGPEQEHLSVIDIPGIFQGITEGVTTREDIPRVRDMVQAYMANSRSVILLVAPANIDLANTAILDMAREVDEHGKRTLGVLTKPDIVNEGAEQDVIDIMEGRTRKLKLGWHILKNPNQKDLSDESYDRSFQEEHFFKTSPHFKHLDKSKRGAPALKIRIQKVLTSLIRHEFPKVKTELNKKLKECRKSLSDLGPSRSTEDEQFKFLLDIASRFQHVSVNALAAKYWVDDIFDKYPSLKLATNIVKRNERFSKTFSELGHTYEFEDEKRTAAPQPVLIQHPVEEEQDEYVNDENYPSSVEESLPKSFNTRETKPNDDIEDMLDENESLDMPQKNGIMLWLSDVYHSGRGFELGNPDPALLAVTFKEQSQNWSCLSKAFVSDAVTIVHNFVTELLRLVCPDEYVRDRLAPILMDGLRERYSKAIEQVNFILHVERSERPATQNHYFNENLQKTRLARYKGLLEKHAFWSTKKDWDTGHENTHKVVRLADTMNTQTMSNVEHIVQDIHDILKSYYKVARKRIVDVICMQAVEHHLISGPETPFELFSPKFVTNMSSEQLEEVAGETYEQRLERRRLQKKMDNLETGKKILA